MKSAVGYSGTSLAKKLGIRENARVLIVNEPNGYRSWLHPLPVGVVFTNRARAPIPFVHLFSTSRRELQDRIASLRARLAPDGVLWVSWPKRTSGVLTDVREDVIREIALPLGLVDVKVCAVSEIWSALKLMIRVEHRS